MDRLLKPAEVGAILGYRDMNRVREIMRSMVHMESPLRVTEKALEKWMNQRMYEGCAARSIGCAPCVPLARDDTSQGSLGMTHDRIPRKKGGRSA